MFDALGSHSAARSPRLRSLVIAFSAVSHCFVGGVAFAVLIPGPVLPSLIEPPCTEFTTTRLMLRWPMVPPAGRTKPGPSIVRASLHPPENTIDGDRDVVAQPREGDDDEREPGNDLALHGGVAGGVCGCIAGALVAGSVGGLQGLPVEPLVLPRLPSEPLRAGAGGPTPVKIVDVQPIYPRLARAARIQGVVILDATIDETGRVVDIRILRSIAPLEHAAIEAIKQWRYQPAVVNGRAVAVVMTITTSFRL